MRLANGPDRSEGILQVWRAGEWGSICDSSPRFPEYAWRVADVACRQLGFKYGAPVSSAPYAATGRIWLDWIYCEWSATRLEECFFQPEASIGRRCRHDMDLVDLAIKCSNIQAKCESLPWS